LFFAQHHRHPAQEVTRSGKSGQVAPKDEPFAERLCQRLTEVRRLRYGERGKSAFARDLGIPVTTYVHYEAGRMPPADLLVRAAHVAGVRLEWLLTGQGRREGVSSRPHDAAQELADRLASLLERSPRLLPSAREFLELLERMQFEASVAPSPSVRPGADRTRLIPVVGSTAAGLAHYWSELETTSGGPEADAHLERKLSQHFERVDEHSPATVAATGAGDERVALVQYAHPDADGFIEFLEAGELKQRYPHAVAWRIDGESMAPRYRDGDLVITSPDQPAVDLHPCVARQAGQIGVNCKLYRRDGDDVLLIPINDASPVQRVPASQLQWAWRVLSAVRLND
jgi:phage repressor protein C with HTH and peptisase S24 domain/transcriptional regulator with XRE-family HTH domain